MTAGRVWWKGVVASQRYVLVTIALAWTQAGTRPSYICTHWSGRPRSHGTWMAELSLALMKTKWIRANGYR